MLPTLIVALLATSALAAPTKQSQKHHHYSNLGSFKVPSKARPDVLTDVDTLRDMKNALSKYNFDLDDFTSKLASFDDVKTVKLGSDSNKADDSALPDLSDIPDAINNIGDALSSFLFGGAPAPQTYAPKPTTSKKHKHASSTASSGYIYYPPVSSYVPVPASSSSEAVITTTPSSTAEIPSSTSIETPPAESTVPASTYVTAPETTEAASTYAPAPETTEAPSTYTSVPATSEAPPSSVVATSELPISAPIPETTTSPAVESTATPTTTSVPTTMVTSIMPSNAFDPLTSEAASPTSTLPATPATSKKAAGTVNATPEENQSEYLAPVTIGGQTLTLDFDTGSADLWVFSNQLSAAQIGGHTAFDPSKSSTWEAASGSSWKISYGDGSTASGNVGYDTVVIGGATATKQAVELATAISTTFANDTNNDGLVGLAFSNINTVTPTKQKTFFENIMDELEQPLFTADLRTDSSSTYEFGTIDANKYTGDIHYTSIDSSKGFWQFPSTSYSVGGTTYQNAQASPAIADTGTSICLLDNAPVTAYYNQVSGATFSSAAGGWLYPCGASLPDFGVAIGDSGFTAVIPGSQVTYAALGDGTCFGGIQSNQGAIGYQILGDTLLKQYFAVFNGGAKTFGLAAKK